MIGKTKSEIIKYCESNKIKYTLTEMDSKAGINYDTELVVRAVMQGEVLNLIVGKFKLYV